MTRAERRIALIRLLAHIDQATRRMRALASQPVLSYDEEEYVALHFQYRHTARKQAERQLRTLDGEGD